MRLLLPSRSASVQPGLTTVECSQSQERVVIVNELSRFLSIPVLLLGSSLLNAEVQRSVLEVPVTAVEPIVQYVTRKIPHETCRDERVRVDRAAANHSATPGILGAVIGGVVGGALGQDSRYQPVTAGAGALLGASVGTDISHRQNIQSYYVTEQRCEVDYELRDQENIIGYRVSYLYGDRIYQTETRQRPGSTIKVRVEISPLQ
jgi:uncharacterized protein YcfJ